LFTRNDIVDEIEAAPAVVLNDDAIGMHDEDARYNFDGDGSRFLEFRSDEFGVDGHKRHVGECLDVERCVLDEGDELVGQFGERAVKKNSVHRASLVTRFSHLNQITYGINGIRREHDRRPNIFVRSRLSIWQQRNCDV
jgi:hypothetical protein